MVCVSYRAGAPAPTGNTLTLVATSRHWSSATDTANYHIPVVAQAVAVKPDFKKVGVIADSSYQYAFTLRNGGSQNELFDIDVRCPAPGFLTCGSSILTITVAAGADSTVMVDYQVPSVGLGASDTLTVIATQRSDSSVIDSGSVFITAGTPQAPLVALEEAGSGSPAARGLCVIAPAGPSAVSECGTMTVSHALPSVTTLNKVRTPILIYNNEFTHPYNIVAANVFLPDSAVTPDSVRAYLDISGALSDTTTFVGTGWSPGRASRIVVGRDGFGRETGVYSYTLEVIAFVGNTPFPVSDNGEIAVVNRRASRYATGWALAGLEQLFFVPGTADRILHVGGDGSAQIYDKVGPTKWMGPALSRPDSIELTQIGADSVYVRRLPGGAHIRFDMLGRHVKTVNRLGHVTRFEYDSTHVTNIPVKHRVLKIWVPLPGGDSLEAYRFEYSSNHLDSVRTLPGSQNLVTRTSGGFMLSQIEDPDGNTVQFGYSTINAWDFRMDWRVDRRGYRTDWTYDSANRLVQVTTQMDPGESPIVTKFRPIETVGLTAGVDTAEAYTLLDGARTDVGDTTMIWHDGLGAPRRIVDALGNETTVERADPDFPALVTETTNPVGLVSEAFYSRRGNLDSTRVARSAGMAVSRYAWDPVWDFATMMVMPMGDTTRIQYDPVTGNREWQRDGRGEPSEVSFTYNADGLLEEIHAPLASAPNAIEYDAYGNMDATVTPLGFRSESYKDAFGRDTLVVTPIDATHSQRQRIVYDVIGRVDSTITIGPDMSVGADTIPAESLVVHNKYDEESNLTEVWRRSYPDVNQIGWVVSLYQHDAASRKIAETQHGRTDRTVYDPAGNAVRLDQAGGDTLYMRYDPLGRLIERITPAKSYAQSGCTQHGISAASVQCGGGMIFPYYPNDSTGLLIPADTARFSYDAVGNVLTADNRYARVHRTYNQDGSLATDSSIVLEYPAFDSSVAGTSFEYDLNGRRTKLTHPTNLAPSGGVEQTYAYHQWGPLDQITNVLGDTYSYAYDDQGRLDSLRYPGGYELRGYDDDGRLVRRVDQAGFLLRSDSIIYDRRGRMTQVLQVGAPTNYWFGTFQYSGLGHLSKNVGTDAAGQALTEVIRSDAGGYQQWKASTLSGGDLDVRNTQHYNAGGLLDFAVDEHQDPVPPLTWYPDSTYRQEDGHGNVRRQGSFQYGWNGQPWPLQVDWFLRSSSESYYGADQKLMFFQVYRDSLDLVAAGTPRNAHGVFEEYRYDALGRRVLKRARSEDLCQNDLQGTARCYSTIEWFVWDGDQILYEVREPGGSAALPDSLHGTVAYTHGPGIDVPLDIVRMGLQGQPALLVVPHYNHRGVADAGTEVGGQRLGCAPGQTFQCMDMGWPGVYGAAFHDANSTDDGVRNPPAWFGSLVQQQRDQSGLMYMRNRYYDPATGQFTQRDPIGISGGLNLYGFANSDPVNFSDPFGLCPWPPESCFQQLANWGAQRAGLIGSAALNIGASGAALLEVVGVNDAAAAIEAVGDGRYAAAAASAFLALPGPGKLGKGAKASRGAFSGVYEFVSETGERYIGQSSNVFRRLREHLGDKLDDINRAIIYPMPGSTRLQREIVEQTMIDAAGGVRALRNVNNPIGAARRHLMEQQ